MRTSWVLASASLIARLRRDPSTGRAFKIHWLPSTSKSHFWGRVVGFIPLLKAGEWPAKRVKLHFLVYSVYIPPPHKPKVDMFCAKVWALVLLLWSSGVSSVTIRLQHCSGGSIQKNIQKNHWRSTPILVQNHLTSLLKIPTIFLLKRQAATSTIQETQQSIGGDEEDLKVRAASYDLWGWEVEISGKDGGCRSNFSSKTYDLTGKEMEISSQTYWWRDIEQHLSWYNDTFIMIQIHREFSQNLGDVQGDGQGFYPWPWQTRLILGYFVQGTQDRVMLRPD